ncbi:MAG: hypothetical protein HYZ94_02060 [Candidatus Omnitrophica bacterium]|nr:hypothetical protein [Candidatus Omnitrophota bacterium]
MLSPGPVAQAEASAGAAGPTGAPGVPDKPPEAILVDDFETGQTQGLFAERKNRLDAFQGTWARRPSSTVITKVLDSRPGSVGHSLRIEFSKSGGWCGWYTLLNGIDVSRHNALSFWVKGEKGGERFDIGMADNHMQELEIDAVYVGSIVSFIPEGVTNDWQEVKIPLQSLRTELDMTRMGSLVLWFRYEGAGAVQLDDVRFAFDPEIERITQQNLPRAQRDERSPRALWVWKWDPVNKPDVRKDMLEFARRTAIERIYIYLGEEPLPKTAKDYQENLAAFVKEAHAQGIEVQALQGNPLWALKEYHSRVTEWIGGFLEFNRARPPEERLDGVHMDIEPYLTQEWETGDREKLKAEFLELLAACRKLIDEDNGKSKSVPGTGTVPGTKSDGPRPWARGPLAKKPFLMGLAIPLFYNREPEMEEKLLSYLDYAALMDYYDTSRDIIQEGRAHMALAEKAGVAMVIGVETQDLVQMNQGKRRNTFFEEGWEEMERELAAVSRAFADSASFDGVAIHCDYSYKMLQRGRNVPTRERSGKVPSMEAAASPAQRATVDGDLADWEGAAWTSLDKRKQVNYGVGAWEGPHDMSFKLAVRWEPEALVMAFDVHDQAVVQEKSGADMWEGDHFEVWFDVDLYGDYNEAVNSGDDFQIGLSPGNFQGREPEVHVWVPSVSPESVKQIRLAAKKTEKGYVIEARFPTSFLFQNIQKKIGVEPGRPELKTRTPVPPEVLAKQQAVLQSQKLGAGFEMGIMVDGSDCDAAHQPQKCLMSSSPERQWGDPTSFNILELK